MLIPVTD